MVRNPVVAGRFYPGDRDTLLEDLEMIMPEISDKTDVIGIVSPHAGYMFSGQVAGEVYAGIVPKDTYIVMGPSHTGKGKRFASGREAWKTPLGTVEVDTDLLSAIMEKTDLLEDDITAHDIEHSIEVQLPFLQKISPDSKIVPISLQAGNIFEYKEIAAAIVAGIRSTNRNVTIIASSDMSHYEPRDSAKKKDKLAIDKVLEIDGEGLISVVEENQITMCGYIPAAVMLMCSKEMGASQGKVVRHTDSGDVTGDINDVVGYAGIIIY